MVCILHLIRIIIIKQFDSFRTERTTTTITTGLMDERKAKHQSELIEWNNETQQKGKSVNINKIEERMKTERKRTTSTIQLERQQDKANDFFFRFENQETIKHFFKPGGDHRTVVHTLTPLLWSPIVDCVSGVAVPSGTCKHTRIHHCGLENNWTVPKWIWGDDIIRHKQLTGSNGNVMSK